MNISSHALSKFEWNVYFGGNTFSCPGAVWTRQSHSNCRILPSFVLFVLSVFLFSLPQFSLLIQSVWGELICCQLGTDSSTSTSANLHVCTCFGSFQLASNIYSWSKQNFGISLIILFCSEWSHVLYLRALTFGIYHNATRLITNIFKYNTWI